MLLYYLPLICSSAGKIAILMINPVLYSKQWKAVEELMFVQTVSEIVMIV